MQFMPWKSEYSVEVTQIDQQHKHLVGMINGLHEAMGRGGKPEEVASLLEDLLTYTRFHFDYEEKLMERVGYAGLPEHREKHRAMKAEVERLLQSAVSGDQTIALKVMTFLKGWLGKHICVTDKEYAPAMQHAGVA